MVVEALPTGRRVALTRHVFEELNGAGELLVHALAQLPDSVHLDLPSSLPERTLLDALARAYGVAERVHFADMTPATGDRRVEALLRDRRPLGEIVEALTDPDDPPAAIRRDDEIFSGHRLGFVTNLPAHYRLPLFAEMSSRLGAVGAAFHVFFLGEGDGSRPWLATRSGLSFEHEFVRSVDVPFRARSPKLPLDLSRRLGRFAPTILVEAGFSPVVAGRVASFARRRGVPWGMISGETLSTAAAHGHARRLQRVRLARAATFAIAYGFAGGEYLKELRPDLPLVYGRNTAPTAEVGSERQDRDGPVQVIVVGDLASPRKGTDVALEALRLSPQLDCRLSVIGGGNLMPELERQAGGDPRAVFLGPLAPEQVRSVYEAADVLLFPTRSDVWGQVIVEAMGAGLATVVSSAAGAVADLAIDGVTALVVRGHEPRAWSHALERVVREPGLRRALGDRARATIHRRWTIEHSADAMLAGFRLGLLHASRGLR